MIYLIMCGGDYHTDEPKQLTVIKGETIVGRTIRLLKSLGINDIAISSNNTRFEQFGVPVLHHTNNFGNGGHWLEAFYPSSEPICYLYGDVVYSEYALKTIVETETDSIQFFASAPPFDKRYFKTWAEPFAFKVVDTKLFKKCINTTLALAEQGVFYRDPISWELWQVIKKTKLAEVDYTNYVIINDWTCDCDCAEDVAKLESVIE